MYYRGSGNVAAVYVVVVNGVVVLEMREIAIRVHR
jgi:hypothetical protein